MDTFTNQGLNFDLDDTGDPGGEAVVALHGFPADRGCWSVVASGLAERGVRVLAPDQRGYSPGAVPSGRRAYAVEALASDVIALADQAGLDRFHLLGHDWGAVVAWHLAATAPERIATLTAVSVPHPAAFVRSMLRSDQALRSWYMLAFQVPRLPERQLAAGGGAWLTRRLCASGLPQEAAERYAARAARRAMTGPVNWYRALPFGARRPLGAVAVPTAMVWSPGDPFCGRAGVEDTARFVEGPYRLVELPVTASHWIPEVEPERLVEVTGGLVREHPARR